MSDKPHQIVVLQCTNCNRESEHEVHYAGRILAHAKCLACGTVISQSPGELRKNYLKDLEHRVSTKPWRLVQRILRDPRYLFTGMPKAILDQPKKFLGEAKELRDPLKHPESWEEPENPGEAPAISQ